MPNMPKVIPAVFPPLFGAVALGMLWQAKGAMYVGWIAAAIWVFFVLKYLGRLPITPGILKRDLDTLPGRTGLVAANLTLMLVSGLVGGESLIAGQVLLVAALLIQVALIAAFLKRVRRDANVRAVQPVWQMIFTGFVVAIPATASLGSVAFAQMLLGYSVASAALIWILTAMQFLKGRFPPPQLRPALFIHLSPAAMIGIGATWVGYPSVALLFFGISVVMLAAMIVKIRWLLVTGFSPFWSSMTFPLVAFASLSFVVNSWLGWGLMMIVTLIVTIILTQIFQMWRRDDELAIATFAA